VNRKYALMYVLSGIVLINIIAIVILSMRVQQETPPQVRPQEIPPERHITKNNPLVRTLLIEDREECPDCFGITLYLSELKDIVNMSVVRVSPDSLGVRYYPALAFNASIMEYPESVSGGWSIENVITISEGEFAGDWYVLYTLNPPFYDRDEERTRGLVTVTYLTMESCDACYAIDYLRELLEEQRVAVKQERVLDVLSPAGQVVIDKYNITAVPTVILDEEAEVYPGFISAWRPIGTKDQESFVLRELHRLGLTYYDLAQERVMEP